VPRMVLPEGEIAGPGGDGRAGAVTRADVAAVASAVLLGGNHDGEVLEVTGREALTLAEMAEVLTREGGRPVAYREETPAEALAARAHYGAPEWLVEAWISTYTAIATGELATVTDTVARLTGREPQTLAEFVRAHPDCLDHVRAR
jgi:NAD(P)H dehydrogenase (quinone)